VDFGFFYNTNIEVGLGLGIESSTLN